MSQQSLQGPPPGPTGPPGPPGERPSKTSGLAIASLILGVLIVVPLAPLVGVILGIVALSKISASGGTLGGKGLAITGIVLGGFFFIVSCLVAPLALVLVPEFRTAGKKVQAIASRNNMQMLGQAILTYQADYDTMPANLQVLVDEQYVDDANLLKHPASSSTLDPQMIDATCDYFYFPLEVPPGEDIPSDVPIAWEKDADWWRPGYVFVLLADGRTESTPVHFFEQDLDRHGELYLQTPILPSRDGYE